MSVSNIAMKAYTEALTNLESKKSGLQESGTENQTTEKNFSQTISESLAKVNQLQEQKAEMIEEFASGESQNVQELMISLQKADIAMKMTTAVRSKVMAAYKELMNMPL